MLKLTTVETGLGAVALAAVTSSAFLMAGGDPQQLLLFFGMVAVALAIAGTILVLRINQYETSVGARLIELLPSELRSFGDHKEIQQLDADGLFVLLKACQQEQQELLNANCLALIHGTQTAPELAQAEDELAQLRAELAALEDQFSSEQLRSSLRGEGEVNANGTDFNWSDLHNPHFYHLGSFDPPQSGRGSE